MNTATANPRHSRSAIRQSTDRRYLALDGWRGICAVIVSIHHFHTSSTISGLPVVTNGYLFVDFFFLLSGFVIAHAYLDRLQSSFDITHMIWRRFCRLWPLHAALLAAFVALEFAVPVIASITGIERGAATIFDPRSGALLAAIPTNLFFLHGLGVHDRLTWNIPSWSISVEFWTYLVFALAVVIFRKRFIIAAAAVAVVSIIIIALLSPAFLAVDNGLGFFRCLSGFFTGLLIYRLVHAPAHLPMPSVLEAAIVVGVVGFVSYASGTRLELAAPLVFGVAVWLFAQERGAISTLLKSQPFQKLGLWSYSIYMVHSLVIAVVHRGLNAYGQVSQQSLVLDARVDGVRQYTITFGNSLIMDFVTLLYAGVVILISAYTWRMIERPSAQYLNDRVCLVKNFSRVDPRAA